MAGDDGQALIMHKRDEVVFGTFWMIVELSSSRNMGFLVSYGLWLLTDDLPLSLSILWPLSHLSLEHLIIFLYHTISLC